MEAKKLAIIGGGPAGLTAAIYAARASLRPILFEGEYSAENDARGLVPLGQLTRTSTIENYPGFPAGDLSSYVASAVDESRGLPPHEGSGITGTELVELMRRQALDSGAEIIEADILSVDFSRRPFKLSDSQGNTHLFEAVIVAVGASANYLGLESESRFKNKGVSACAVCDGALPRFREKPLAVVGGGDAAVEEALYLTRFASRVYLIHRRAELRASSVMAKRALANSKIEIVWNRTVREVLGNDQDGVTGLRLASTVGEPDLELAVTGLFLGIGHTPNTAFLNGQLQLTPQGFIERPVPFSSHTSVPGVFAAGDAADWRYQQAVTAAASGCTAALDAEKFLQKID